MEILCTKCGKACSKDEYRVHVSNNCQPTVECQLCHQHYCNAAALLRHTRAIHEKEFQCTVCQSATFASKYNLQRHMAYAHKQIEKDTFRCEECDESFMGKYFLNKHIKGFHKKQYTCQVCKQEFLANPTLKRHMLRRHKNISIDAPAFERAECPECGKLFVKTALERHFRSRHSKLFTCHICERSLKNEKSLQKHLDCRHPEEKSEEALFKKTFKCPICPQRFTACWTMKTHIKAKHEQKYICELCDKALAGPYPLLRHKKNVHGLNIEEQIAVSKRKRPQNRLDNKLKSGIDGNVIAPLLTDQGTNVDKLKKREINKKIF